MTDRTADTLIVGAGIAGIGLAYFLAQRGAQDIVVLDAGEVGAGATAWSLGGVRQQFSHPAEVELAAAPLPDPAPETGKAKRKKKKAQSGALCGDPDIVGEKLAPISSKA